MELLKKIRRVKSKISKQQDVLFSNLRKEMAPLGDLFLWILNVLFELQEYSLPTNQPTGRGNSFSKNPFSIPPMEVPVQSSEGAEHKGCFVPLRLFTVLGTNIKQLLHDSL